MVNAHSSCAFKRRLTVRLWLHPPAAGCFLPPARAGGRKAGGRRQGRCNAARDGASGSVLCVPMTFTVFIPVLRDETCHVSTFADFYCARKKLKAVSQVEMARNPARKLYRARNRDFLSPEIKRPPCRMQKRPILAPSGGGVYHKPMLKFGV